jgi:hypothetical protein
LNRAAANFAETVEDPDRVDPLGVEELEQPAAAWGSSSSRIGRTSIGVRGTLAVTGFPRSYSRPSASDSLNARRRPPEQWAHKRLERVRVERAELAESVGAVFYVLEVEGGLRLEGDGTAARS